LSLAPGMMRRSPSRRGPLSVKELEGLRRRHVGAKDAIGREMHRRYWFALDEKRSKLRDQVRPLVRDAFQGGSRTIMRPDGSITFPSPPKAPRRAIGDD